jgi:hypothetical protein
MHRYTTRSGSRLALALPLLLLAAGCDRQDAANAEASPTPTPTTTAAPSPGLDLGALIERKNPARVLDFYAAALAAGEWATAARAWGEAFGMTGDKLKAEFGGKGSVTLGISGGLADGAAGSLFYEAPVIVRFGNGEERKGTITLRRVNDVEGASDEQLRWHIERSSFES